MDKEMRPEQAPPPGLLETQIPDLAPLDLKIDLEEVLTASSVHGTASSSPRGRLSSQMDPGMELDEYRGSLSGDAPASVITRVSSSETSTGIRTSAEDESEHTTWTFPAFSDPEIRHYPPDDNGAHQIPDESEWICSGPAQIRFQHEDHNNKSEGNGAKIPSRMVTGRERRPPERRRKWDLRAIRSGLRRDLNRANIKNQIIIWREKNEWPRFRVMQVSHGVEHNKNTDSRPTTWIKGTRDREVEDLVREQAPPARKSTTYNRRLTLGELPSSSFFLSDNEDEDDDADQEDQQTKSNNRSSALAGQEKHNRATDNNTSSPPSRSASASTSSLLSTEFRRHHHSSSPFLDPQSQQQLHPHLRSRSQSKSRTSSAYNWLHLHENDDEEEKEEGEEQRCEQQQEIEIDIGIIEIAEEVIFRRPVIVEHVPGTKVGLKAMLAAGPSSTRGGEGGGQDTKAGGRSGSS